MKKYLKKIKTNIKIFDNVFKKNKKKNPYVIAEIGVNHECSLKKAKKLIDLAVKGGAHAAISNIQS